MVGVGLYIEENTQEILSRFQAAVTRELGFDEPSLRLAAPILLQEIGRALRRGVTAGAEPWKRSALLIVSQPAGGIRGLLREFALLRRSMWETLATRGHAVPGDERRQVDMIIDEALAYAAERWAGLVRVLPQASLGAAPRGARPPLSRSGAAAGAPPPLPKAR